MGSFVHLHLHTMYSLLDAVSTSEDYVEKAAVMEHKAMAITDHGRMSGIYEHQNACRAKGITPIIGMEAYLNETLRTTVTEKTGKAGKDKTKRIRTKDSHIILLVKSKEGYRNLLTLNYKSNIDDTHYYYKPRISFDDLVEHKKGLVVGTACIAGPISSALRFGNEEEAAKIFLKYREQFGDDFFAEIQINELTRTIDNLLEGQKTYNKFIIDQANLHGVPVVLTGDVHYASKEDYAIQELSLKMLSKSSKKKEKTSKQKEKDLEGLNDKEREEEKRKEKEKEEDKDVTTFDFEAKNLYYHDIDDFKKLSEQFGYGYSKTEIEAWCEHSVDISEKCSFSIPERTKMHLPVSFGSEENDVEKFIEMAETGFAKLGKDKEPEYRKRFDKEMSVYLKKGMAPYILVLRDMFNSADKEWSIRGPARGSACGSLILYCIGITSIDPLKNGLIFERFVSSERSVSVVHDFFGTNENKCTLDK